MEPFAQACDGFRCSASTKIPPNDFYNREMLLYCNFQKKKRTIKPGSGQGRLQGEQVLPGAAHSLNLPFCTVAVAAAADSN